jgi:hypothetical protein
VFAACGRWNRGRLGQFNQRRVGRVPAAAPELLVAADRVTVLLADVSQRLLVKLVEPRLLRESEAADWTARLLDEDHVAAVDELEGRASDPAETGLRCLVAVEDECQERLGEDREVQPNGA